MRNKRLRPFFRAILIAHVALFGLQACSDDGGRVIGPRFDTLDLPNALFTDATDESIPFEALASLSTEGRSGDLDGDGDLDLIITGFFGRPLLLINGGDGVFTLADPERLPSPILFGRDVGLSDLDRDGDLDVVITSQSVETTGFYLNDGAGFFTGDATALSVDGPIWSVAIDDLDVDGWPDLLFGTESSGVLLFLGSPTGFAAAQERLPQIDAAVRHVELGDVDADGLADLVLSTDDGVRLLINDGGTYEDRTEPDFERTRGIDVWQTALGDIDGDGDLDVAVGTEDRLISINRLDLIYLNDGAGGFTDDTLGRLAPDRSHTLSIDLVDVDGDGTLDVAKGTILGTDRFHLNDGSGVFSDKTAEILPLGMVAEETNTEDWDFGDYNGDGLLDMLQLRSNGTDRLYLRKPPSS